VCSRCIGRTKGGLNSKLHAVCDEQGKPMILLLTEGQMSDHTGARLLIEKLPAGSTLIGDRGYDSKSFPHRSERAWDQGVHSADQEPPTADRLRQGALQEGATRSRICLPD
jgi:transposase